MNAKKNLTTFMIAMAGGIFALGATGLFKTVTTKRVSVQPDDATVQLTSIDKKPVKSMEDITNALKNKSGGILIEGIYPNGLKAYYGFGM